MWRSGYWATRRRRTCYAGWDRTPTSTPGARAAAHHQLARPPCAGSRRRFGHRQVRVSPSGSCDVCAAEGRVRRVGGKRGVVRPGRPLRRPQTGASPAGAHPRVPSGRT